LNKLVNLTDLRIRNNPLNRSKRQDEFRGLVVAKIAKVKMLNRTNLKNYQFEDQRQGAEFDYLRENAIEWSDVKDLKETDERKVKFLREHPRYPDLIQSK
jgi:hypothetical protein